MLREAPGTSQNFARICTSGAAAGAMESAAPTFVSGRYNRAGLAVNAVLSAADAVVAPGQWVANSPWWHEGARR